MASKSSVCDQFQPIVPQSFSLIALHQQFFSLASQGRKNSNEPEVKNTILKSLFCHWLLFSSFCILKSSLIASLSYGKTMVKVDPCHIYSLAQIKLFVLSLMISLAMAKPRPASHFGPGYAPYPLETSDQKCEASLSWTALIWDRDNRTGHLLFSSLPDPSTIRWVLDGIVQDIVDHFGSFYPYYLSTPDRCDRVFPWISSYSCIFLRLTLWSYQTGLNKGDSP